MKANKFVKKCGPFKVASISQDGRGVRMVVYPAFPTYGEHWAIHRMKGEGGGPSIFMAMGLARALEEFLNQPYEEATINQWNEKLGKMMEEGKKIETGMEKKGASN